LPVVDVRNSIAARSGGRPPVLRLFRSFIYIATLRFSPMLGLEPVSAAAAIFT
jgi:hypothetical protein